MKQRAAPAWSRMGLAIGLVAALAALAGAWSDPMLLNTTGTADSQPDGGPVLFSDSSGTRHAVWISAEDLGGAGNDWDLFHATDVGAGWSAPVLLNTNATTDSGSDTRPGIAEGACGTLYVVWQSDDDLGGAAGTDLDIFWSWNAGAGWSAPALLNSYGTSDDRPDEAPSIVADAAGNLCAAWYSYVDVAGSGTDADILYSTNSGGGWSAPALLNSTGASDTGGDYFPRLIRGSDGDLHAIWYSDAGIGGTGSDGDIFLATYGGAGWSAPALVNSNGTADSGLDQEPWIIMDSMGVLHAAWSSTEDLGGTAGTDLDFFHAWNAGAGWSAPTVLNSYGSSDDAWDAGIRLLEDSNGTLHAVWYSQYDLGGTAGTDWDIVHATFDGPGWSAASLLNTNGNSDTGTDNSVSILESPQGTLLAAWQSNADLGGLLGTDDDILYATQILPTPEPTGTPTPTPTAVWYDLDMPDLMLQPGETFRLLEHTGNPLGTDLAVDAYIILDVYGEYWFFPGWTQSLDCWSGSLAAGTSYDSTVLEFAWPTGAGSATGIKFWGGLLHQGTADLIILDMIEWGFNEP